MCVCVCVCVEGRTETLILFALIVLRKITLFLLFVSLLFVSGHFFVMLRWHGTFLLSVTLVAFRIKYKYKKLVLVAMVVLWNFDVVVPTCSTSMFHLVCQGTTFLVPLAFALSWKFSSSSCYNGSVQGYLFLLFHLVCQWMFVVFVVVLVPVALVLFRHSFCCCFCSIGFVKRTFHPLRCWCSVSRFAPVALVWSSDTSRSHCMHRSFIGHFSSQRCLVLRSVDISCSACTGR